MRKISAILLVLYLSACGKDKDKKPAGPEAKPIGDAVTKLLAELPARPAAFGINASKLRTSPMYALAKGFIDKSLGLPSACKGILDSVDTIVMTTDLSSATFAAISGAPKAKVSACLSDPSLASQMVGRATVSPTASGFLVDSFRFQGELAWRNGVMVAGPKGKVAQAPKTNAGSDAQLKGLIGYADTGRMMWFASTEIHEILSMFTGTATSMFMGFDLTDTLMADIGFLCPDAKGAKALTTELKTNLDGLKHSPFKKYISKIQIRQADKYALININLEHQDVMEIVELVKQSPEYRAIAGR